MGILTPLLNMKQRNLLTLLHLINHEPGINNTTLSNKSGMHLTYISQLISILITNQFVENKAEFGKSNHFYITKEGRIARICLQFLENGERLENVTFRVQ